MKLSTGRWVSGDDFFGRERELMALRTLVQERNHFLLTGQRRMGKTSVLKELGRRLQTKNWEFLFADVEAAACAEDAIAAIARPVYPVRSMASRFAIGMRRWLGENIEEVNAFEFAVKIRAGLNAGNWKRHGEKLLRICAEHEKPVLLVIDELPIFLKRMLRGPDGQERVDEFLSWLRGVLQDTVNDSLVLAVSGSIGLQPLVRRLGISDRVNHLYPFRLGPWDREESIACFRCLAKDSAVQFDEGVADAVYERLGIGIPHHVQSFFARLRDFAIMRDRESVTLADVDDVYRNDLLGPSGQSDLVHYETRLKDGLDGQTYTIAMQILAEAATRGIFSQGARRCLEQMYERLLDDPSANIADAIDVLVHDGYLEVTEGGYRFPSKLLEDWWASRFREHHVPLESMQSRDGSH